MGGWVMIRWLSVWVQVVVSCLSPQVLGGCVCCVVCCLLWRVLVSGNSTRSSTFTRIKLDIGILLGIKLGNSA